MHALVCLSGLESRRFMARALALLPRPELRLTLLYVADTRPPHEAGYARRALHWAGLGPDPAEVERVERAIAAEVFAEAAAVTAGAGLGADRIATHLVTGRPEREIVRLGAEQAADVIVIGAHHRGGPLTGPASVGPVARYVLDHAAGPVLLLRSERADDD